VLELSQLPKLASKKETAVQAKTPYWLIERATWSYLALVQVRIQFPQPSKSANQGISPVRRMKVYERPGLPFPTHPLKE
jgi:hypothetical protein